jgi:hypothetical protein
VVVHDCHGVHHSPARKIEETLDSRHNPFH